jgi:type IV pilus assembly protein PilV
VVSRARGFTLVEVLVALVVISVGMLGIAGLYLESLRAGRSALYRTQAVSLAADMADRIRANPAARAAYAGTGPGADQACVNGAVDCSPDELAADDWFHWQEALAAQLPADTTANIGVAVDAVTNVATYTIDLQWPEVGQPDAPSSYRLSVQL